jgi:hypothetical protein
MRCRGFDLGQDPDRLTRNAQCMHPISLPDGNDAGADDRMEMEVHVGIDVVQFQAGRAVGLELSGNLRCQLVAHARSEDEFSAEADQIGPQSSRSID